MKIQKNLNDLPAVNILLYLLSMYLSLSLPHVRMHVCVYVPPHIHTSFAKLPKVDCRHHEISHLNTSACISQNVEHYFLWNHIITTPKKLTIVLSNIRTQIFSIILKYVFKIQWFIAFHYYVSLVLSIYKSYMLLPWSLVILTTQIVQVSQPVEHPTF